MIRLKSEIETPRRQRHYARLLVLLVLVPVAALVVERWRGQGALKVWKRQMAAKGKIFEAERLWPTPSPRSLEFSNRLAQVIGQLPTGLAHYAGRNSGIVHEQPGKVRGGGQGPYPQ